MIAITYYWNCKTDRIYFLPYLQAGIEKNLWQNDLFIEIGWLNRWAAIEIRIKTKTPHRAGRGADLIK